MKRSYIDYAMSVIIGAGAARRARRVEARAPRVLYGDVRSRATRDKPYKKSARIVGDVMGKYHPHGDAAIYDAVVRMAQEFSMRYPLVDGQGNFGSIDGDNPAAMRYTEVRLTKLAEEMLKDDIDKGHRRVGCRTTTARCRSRRCCRRKRPAPPGQRQLRIAVGMATNIPAAQSRRSGRRALPA
jgi:DNA gyrase subunit A